MKVTIFTSNNFRHNYLINEIAKIADEINVIQECNTLFPGYVSDFRIKNLVVKKYFERVSEAQRKIFNNEPISVKKKINLLSVKYGDLNLLSQMQLKNFLNSEIYIVFGSSFIKGKLINFLHKKKAINIHMGISPYFRGTDSNFWAIYTNNFQFVGATIHYLNSGLDDGKILYHALAARNKNPFLYSMLTVKSAIKSLSAKIKNREIFNYNPVSQEKKKLIKYSTKKDFIPNKLKKFDKLIIPRFKHEKSLFVRPYIYEHNFK